MSHAWDNFFIMAGQAAATLIGLLFVTVSVASGFSQSSMEEGTHGFLTPTFVQFGTVLFQCLALLAPWPSPWPIAIILGLHGLAGLAYQIRTIFMRRQLALAVLQAWDWLPYTGVPAIGYAGLIVGATGLPAAKSFAPYAIAAAIWLLLFAGIYGAWDITLWIIKHRDKT